MDVVTAELVWCGFPTMVILLHRMWQDPDDGDRRDRMMGIWLAATLVAGPVVLLLYFWPRPTTPRMN